MEGARFDGGRHDGGREVKHDLVTLLGTQYVTRLTDSDNINIIHRGN